MAFERWPECSRIIRDDKLLDYVARSGGVGSAPRDDSSPRLGLQPMLDDFPTIETHNRAFAPSQPHSEPRTTARPQAPPRNHRRLSLKTVPGWMSAYALAETYRPDKRVISATELGIWRALQSIVLAVGLTLVWLLAFEPKIGINLMWSVIIPVAPFLVTVAPGLWRNICPMATVGLLPRLLGFSLEVTMPRKCVAVMGALSVAGLYFIVPLRQVLLNMNGPATAIMLVAAAVVAFSMGMVFQWRSGWCTSLCPIHAVEKLYGTSPAIELKNARCRACQQCTNPCPDSTPGMTPTITGPTWLEEKIGRLLTGSFVGFVWGWFQVPNYTGLVGVDEIVNTYAWPLGCALASYVVFEALNVLFNDFPKVRGVIARSFAAGAVSTYYWYVVPTLFYKHTGMLPFWFPLASHVVTTTFFVCFLVLRPVSGKSWLTRPKSPPTNASSGMAAASV
jgi:hypothetical protein